MKRLLSYFALIVTVLQGSALIAQQQFFIKDSFTEEAMPFVKVFPNIGKPILADMDGMFKVEQSVSSVRLSFIEYEDTTIVLSDKNDSVIYMRRVVQEVAEMIVLPGENPAHRIIKAAQENRKNNHPLKNGPFEYTSYSKFVFDVNKNIMESDGDEDTTTAKLKDYFTKQHLFVAESATKRTFESPGKDKEEIRAYKLSGLKDPSLSTFAQSMQSFNFYDNEFKILGQSFSNPLAGDGINRYLFILEDTLVQEKDTTYTIFFRPRKGKNFKGLTGRLYINTNGFAVEKVNAETTGGGQFDVIIIQEYEFINNERWFPVQLSTDLSFGALETKASGTQRMILGTGHTYIDSIVFNPQTKRKGFNDNINLYTSDNAGEAGEKEWEQLRKYRLTEKEQRTHIKVDSLAKAENFEQKLGFINELASGSLRWGYIAFPLERLFVYNQFEGYRLGAGIETSSKVSKHFKIGGYAGWGTKDKQWKYGGYSTIHISKKRSTRFDLSFQEDILERGSMNYAKSALNLINNDLMRSFFIQQAEYQRKAEVAFSTDIKANMNIRLSGNYQRIKYSEDYQFIPISEHIDRVDVAEFGLEAKWNIGEKYMLLGDTKVSQGLKYPSIRLKAIKGISGIWESEFDYWRLNASISQKFSVRDYFSVSLNLVGSKTIGEIPLFLMHNGNGTRIDWMIDVENTFQTMVAGSFYNSEQAAFFTRIKFKEIHTNAKWNEPRFGLHHAIGYGQMDKRENHDLEFETMKNGYFEAGLILDNLLIMNKISGFGVGLFYRYDSGGNSDWKKNLVPKISLNVVL